MYSACVTDCGWSTAGVPALASITATCAGQAGTAETSGAAAASLESSTGSAVAATTSSST